VSILASLIHYNGWHLYAVDVSPIGDPTPIVIATFDTKEEAEMALMSLFDRIKNDFIWSAESFKEIQNISAVHRISTPLCKETS
jgi:hypothetical protein